ncbi:MAG: HD domain-containing phosphohydrolase [Candidatus Brocadiia bacterium]
MEEGHRVLVVDDEEGVREVLARGLVARGLTCHTAADGHRAMAILGQQDHGVVLADIRMPGLDGLQLLERIKRQWPLTEVIIITGVFELESAVEAMRRGAYDYVTKPFDVNEVVFAVERALHKRQLEVQNWYYRENLETEVELRSSELLESNHRLQQLFVAMLKTLANTVEAKAPYTHGHSRRVAEGAVQVGHRLGLARGELSQLELGGLLHDIGKIGVREAVLHKPGRLTPEEYDHVKRHCQIGEHILRPVDQLAAILDYVRHHHEAFDGTGYPDGLAGDALSTGARILAVCDAYDAMTSERPYRRPFSHGQACDELRRCRAAQFDPQVADAFLALYADPASAHEAGAAG